MRNPMLDDPFARIGEFFPCPLAFCPGRLKSLMIPPDEGCQPRRRNEQPGDQCQTSVFQIAPCSAEFRFDVHPWLPSTGARREVNGSRERQSRGWMPFYNLASTIL